jgi:protein-L-isoaspartate(D-aspartate) O-methyltransferase
MTTGGTPGRDPRRDELVRLLQARGVADARVLEAMATVPREGFVAEDLGDVAYADSPLPIGRGQTVSQPYVVALMAETLQLGARDRVLEVGTGSGYGAAVLAELAAEVLTVERDAELAATARERLAHLGYARVEVREGDGREGWPERAPFDAVVVTAAAPEVPRALGDQLAVGGRLVAPVGAQDDDQSLVRLHRVSHDEYRREDLGGVRFVPLRG